MSFGFSPSDILTLIQLTSRAYNGWRDATGNYQEVTTTLRSFELILERIRVLTIRAEHDSDVAASITEHARRRQDGKALEDILAGSEGAVKSLYKLSKRYCDVPSSHIARLRFGRKDVERPLDRLDRHVSSLNVFLQTVELDSIDKLTTLVTGRLDALPETISRKVTIALGHVIDETSLDAHSARESLLSSYGNDDKLAWREFRRALRQQGISDSIVREHWDRLQQFVRALVTDEGEVQGDKRVRDEDKDDKQPSRACRQIHGTDRHKKEIPASTVTSEYGSMKPSVAQPGPRLGSRYKKASVPTGNACSLYAKPGEDALHVDKSVYQATVVSVQEDLETFENQIPARGEVDGPLIEQVEFSTLGDTTCTPMDEMMASASKQASRRSHSPGIDKVCASIPSNTVGSDQRSLDYTDDELFPSNAFQQSPTLTTEHVDVGLQDRFSHASDSDQSWDTIVVIRPESQHGDPIASGYGDYADPDSDVEANVDVLSSSDTSDDWHQSESNPQPGGSAKQHQWPSSVDWNQWKADYHHGFSSDSGHPWYRKLLTYSPLDVRQEGRLTIKFQLLRGWKIAIHGGVWQFKDGFAQKGVRSYFSTPPVWRELTLSSDWRGRYDRYQAELMNSRCCVGDVAYFLDEDCLDRFSLTDQDRGVQVCHCSISWTASLDSRNEMFLTNLRNWALYQTP